MERPVKHTFYFFQHNAVQRHNDAIKVWKITHSMNIFKSLQKPKAASVTKIIKHTMLVCNTEKA